MNLNRPEITIVRWLLNLVAASLSVLTLHAAEGTATITGRVQNVESGQYLNVARVTIRGTDRAVFTDQTGTYRMGNVPAGPVTLEVFYTGLTPQVIQLTLTSGVHEQDVNLSRAGKPDVSGAPVQLDSFVVATARETDGEAIAINEQRFAPNIKNVVAATTLGDVMDGNIGEFLKFLPGITAEYDTENGGAVAAISIRGIGSSLTTVSSDGAQMASTSNAQGSTRSFQFSQASINNISRIEVTKVPTPANPADSLAGSINMVTKSAFERSKAQFSYSVSLSANHKSLDLGKTAHTDDREIYKLRPSFSFDYTVPVNKKFGLVVTGQSMNRFIQQYIFRRNFNTLAAAGASFERPFFQSYRLLSTPRINERNSVGLKVDWRVTPSSVLSFSLQAGRFASDRTPIDVQWGVGSAFTPTVAGGAGFSFGEDFSSGAMGRGTMVTQAGAGVNQVLNTRAGNLRYRLDDGTWRVEAGLSKSISKGGYGDTKYGHFRQFGISALNPVRISITDINDDRPGTIRGFDNANREIDIYDPANYRLSTANSTPRDIYDDNSSASLDVRRTLPGFSFPLAVQAGGGHRRQIRDVRRVSMNWTYAGLDGDIATVETPAPYLNTRYRNQDAPFGLSAFAAPSTYRAWEAFQQNPNLFVKTPAQVVAEESFRISNSEYIEESVSSAYGQVETGLLNNRLKLLTGVRFEKTTDDGQGPLVDPAAVFQRTATGSFARTPAGARIRKPEAGVVGSMEELRLIRKERAAFGNRTYDGFYPSAHLTYQIKENFLARAAYAKTYGRPNFTEVIPNSSISEADIDNDVADPSVLRGRINVNNTGLRPWTADNYDLSLEYYTQQGGLFSVGAFRKDIADFFGDSVRIGSAADIGELGLDPRYLGWEISTTRNVGDARVSGVEFNVRHSLRALGGWGRYFQGFVNGTRLHLEGNQEASFNAFVPKSMNWGVDFRRQRFAAMLKWNYRGLQQLAAVAALGPDGHEYNLARTTLDVNLEYQVRRWLVVYANGQNVFNVYDVFHRYSTLTPEYAKHINSVTHGVQITLGVKGTF